MAPLLVFFLFSGLVQAQVLSPSMPSTPESQIPTLAAESNSLASECESKEFYKHYLNKFEKESYATEQAGAETIDYFMTHHEACIKKLKLNNKSTEKMLRNARITDAKVSLHRLSTEGMDDDHRKVLMEIARIQLEKYPRDAEAMELLETVKKFEKGDLLPANTNEKCKAMNVTDKLGAVQFQGSLGWCTSYAVANYLSFFLGTTLNPIDIAVSYNIESVIFFSNDLKKILIGDDKKALYNEGAFPEDILKHLQKTGVCSVDSYTAEVKKLASRTNSEWVKKRSHSCTTAMPLPQEFQQTAEEIGIKSMLLHLQEACKKNRLSLDVVKNIKMYKTGDSSELMTKLSTTLDKDEPSLISVVDRRGGHSLVAAGRRWDPINNKCQILIRDSNRTPFFKSTRNQVQVIRDGEYWVDENLVQTHIVQVSERN